MISSPALPVRSLCRLLLVWAVAMLPAVAQAAGAVRASLTRGFTAVGDPVQYQIKISGVRSVNESAPEIAVQGLIVRHIGTDANVVKLFNNGVFTSEKIFVLSYEVTPEKSGSFTIPAVTLEADGKTFRTEPVGLTVQPGSAGGTGNDPQAVGFAEFVLPKKTAYVGEMIPVDLRLYVDARVRWAPVVMPDIGGEGFTKQKMPEPTRAQAQKNGREYDVLVFKTAITPSRAGTITIGPSEIPYNARIPRARKGGPRSLFDMFDDDVFGDPMYSSTQQLKAKAPAIELTVNPLPAAGKPADFSGAVGTFQFSAEGSPKQVKIGDPITMKLRVNGRGNFDRITAPALRDPAGWRTYPPASNFRAEDELLSTGTKTFEMAVVPETRKTAMPVFQFSYFDPLAEKYVTLNSEPAPLSVEGNAPPVAPPKAPVDAANNSTPPAAAPARPDDILGPRYDQEAVRDYTLLHARPGFWYAQGGMAGSLLVFLGLRLRRRPDAAARLEAGLRREKATALARLRSTDLGHVDFLETAARVAQIETALATGRNAASVDAVTVRGSAPLSEESAAVIDEVFDSRAELLYAGGGRQDGQVSAQERERVLNALRELEKSHDRP